MPTNVVWRMTESTIANWTVGNLTISNTAVPPARLELAGTQPLSVSVANLRMTGSAVSGLVVRVQQPDGERFAGHQRWHV